MKEGRKVEVAVYMPDFFGESGSLTLQDEFQLKLSVSKIRRVIETMFDCVDMDANAEIDNPYYTTAHVSFVYSTDDWNTIMSKAFDSDYVVIFEPRYDGRPIKNEYYNNQKIQGLVGDVLNRVRWNVKNRKTARLNLGPMDIYFDYFMDKYVYENPDEAPVPADPWTKENPWLKNS